MDRTAIRNMVIANTRRSDRASDINAAIDFALAEISQVSEFRLTRVTTDINLPAEGQRVTLPSDYFELINVILLDDDETVVSTQLEVRDRLLLEDLYPNLASGVTSQPKFCFVDDETGELVVIPPATEQWTLRVSYQRLFPELTGDSDTVSRKLAYAVVSWVTAFIFRSTQQYPDAVQWFGEYQRALMLAIKADRRTSVTRTMQGFSQGEASPVTAQSYLDPFNNGDGTSHD